MQVGRGVGFGRTRGGMGMQPSQMFSGLLLFFLSPHASCTIFSIPTSSFLSVYRLFPLLYAHGCPIGFQIRKASYGHQLRFSSILGTFPDFLVRKSDCRPWIPCPSAVGNGGWWGGVSHSNNEGCVNAVWSNHWWCGRDTFKSRGWARFIFKVGVKCR